MTHYLDDQLTESWNGELDEHGHAPQPIKEGAVIEIFNDLKQDETVIWMVFKIIVVFQNEDINV